MQVRLRWTLIINERQYVTLIWMRGSLRRHSTWRPSNTTVPEVGPHRHAYNIDVPSVLAWSLRLLHLALS